MSAIYDEDRDRFWWWKWGWWCLEQTHPQERSFYVFGTLHAGSIHHGLGPKDPSYKVSVCPAKSFLLRRDLPPNHAKYSWYSPLSKERCREMSLSSQCKRKTWLSVYFFCYILFLGAEMSTKGGTLWKGWAYLERLSPWSHCSWLRFL